MKNFLTLVPPELGARGRIDIDLARFETCVYTVAQKLWRTLRVRRSFWGFIFSTLGDSYTVNLARLLLSIS